MNGWQKKPIDKMEMLHILGLIYARTATGLAKGGLARMIQTESKPTVKAKYTFVLKALVRQSVLFKEGKVGRGRSYRWNLKEYGPPSIPLAQMVIAETEHQIRMDAAWKREMKRLRVKNEKQS